MYGRARRRRCERSLLLPLGVREVSSVLSELDVATRHWHAAVDEPWLDLLRPTVSRADYVAQLRRVYGFVAPFESACKYTPGLERVLDVRRTSRAGLIAQDLLALGLSPGQVANVEQCFSITTFEDVAEALGWVYVVERSSLLQGNIRRHLLERLPGIEKSCTYLTVYDGSIGEHRAAFGRTLDRIGAQAADIIDGAHAAFACVRRWFGLDAKRSA